MVGERLRKARNQKGLTQEELGKALGVTKTTISQYEGETRDPDSDTVGKLALLLDVSATWLLGLSDNPLAEHDYTPDQVREAIATYETKLDPRSLKIASELTRMGFPFERRRADLLNYARFLAQQEQGSQDPGKKPQE